MRNPLPLVLSLVLTLAAPAAAQTIDLPRPSPLAKVSQVVGLTEVALEYSSPAVKGRKIWGGLVPYGKPWRTGANAATRISFSKEVTVAGKPVPAGTYSLHTLPGKEAWTVVINRNPTASVRDYKPDLDVVRAPVKARPAPPRERLTFVFADTTEATTSLDLEWAGLRVSIPIKAGTDAQVAAALKDLEGGLWRADTQAARYLLESKKDYDRALKFVDRSLSLKEEWFNSWTKAQILAAQGKRAAACPLALKARALGEKAPYFFFADEVKRAIVDWKCK
jgi:hypothetical protein